MAHTISRGHQRRVRDIYNPSLVSVLLATLASTLFPAETYCRKSSRCPLQILLHHPPTKCTEKWSCEIPREWYLAHQHTHGRSSKGLPSCHTAVRVWRPLLIDSTGRDPERVRDDLVSTMSPDEITWLNASRGAAILVTSARRRVNTSRCLRDSCNWSAPRWIQAP
jgi:hypothetical protein